MKLCMYKPPIFATLALFIAGLLGPGAAHGLQKPKNPARPKVSAAKTAKTWVRSQRALMGTRFTIIALATGDQRQALDKALERVDRLEKAWSPWIKGSELSQLNAAKAGAWVAMSKKTTALLRRTMALCTSSGGAFDATFFSLHGLWKLKARPFAPPTDAAIKARLPAVGCTRWQVDARRNRARRMVAATRIHLGGNAKGTALDEAAVALRKAGVTRFVVDGGGDIVTSGRGPKGPWRVGVRNPRGKAGQVAAVVRVETGESVATSGDYERFVDVGGKRFHHIVDPRTGYPAVGVRQVTLVVPSGAHAGEKADGLCTAVFVLGPRKGRALVAKHPGIDVLIIDSAGNWHFNAGMRRRLGGLKAKGAKQKQKRK